ncbi:SDR family NAD(P)-dependent oxidoreductase [Pararobbsia silviterrae]|uniref:SDR family oxidoreductase n=1 Tax=Pararobbsia silviterrae TaxID=1792498 RepID=A0A494WZG4_9BURK|nr:SDR family oxidoreductase [Pararobbsia silviterrae]RKP43915.1 SDR family oxidoreductase [Pararobbsia silviterrae]
MKVHYDFSGHTVLVVGAASGIGRETALQCAARGASVWAADISASGLQSLPSTLRSAVVDISNPTECDALVEHIVAADGRIDAAILTSAIQHRMPIDVMPDAQWQRHLDVNLSGVFYTLRALMPVMKRQRNGSVVAFTSGLASNGWPGAAAYAASKAGIVGLVKCAALELREYGVRVNALSPGLVATPVFLEAASDEELKGYERTVGVSSPDAVVPTLLHLIADGSRTISGTVVERRLVPAS